MSVYRSRRVRLPVFMWQALDVLTEHVNQTAISDPANYINVSGLIQTVVLMSVKVETLRTIAESSPEFQRAIAAWADEEIERDPRAVAIFSSPLWNFTRKPN